MFPSLPHLVTIVVRKMKTFETITKKLNTMGIPFEELTFTDTNTSARTKDTSTQRNYIPDEAVKTIMIKAKSGVVAILLRGRDRINTSKLKSVIGKWSIVRSKSWKSHLVLCLEEYAHSI